MNLARGALRALGFPVQILLIGGVKLYRATLGSILGGQCRFYPSCSHYGEAVIRSRGAVEGSVLAVWRVLRCHPFSRGGVDMPPKPVGEHAKYDAAIHPKGLA